MHSAVLAFTRVALQFLRTDNMKVTDIALLVINIIISGIAAIFIIVMIFYCDHS